MLLCNGPLLCGFNVLIKGLKHCCSGAPGKVSCACNHLLPYALGLTCYTLTILVVERLSRRLPRADGSAAVAAAVAGVLGL